MLYTCKQSERNTKSNKSSAKGSWDWLFYLEEEANTDVNYLPLKMQIFITAIVPNSKSVRFTVYHNS